MTLILREVRESILKAIILNYSLDGAEMSHTNPTIVEKTFARLEQLHANLSHVAMYPFVGTIPAIESQMKWCLTEIVSKIRVDVFTREQRLCVPITLHGHSIMECSIPLIVLMIYINVFG